MSPLLIRRMVLMLLLAALLFGGLFGWKIAQFRAMAAQGGPPRAPMTVAAAEARLQTWQPFLPAVGSLTADQGIEVTSEVAGLVREILFESGATVEPGTPLVRLDDRADRAELSSLLAQERLAELEFRRTERLFNKGTASQSEFDQAKAVLDSLRAQVRAKREMIDKKEIRAPFGGELGIRRIDIGQFVLPGAPLVPLQALDPIHVDYTLPERHWGRVRTGQTVTLRVQPLGDRTFEGAVTALDPGVDPGTRTFRVRATLANPEGVLRPGMFADVRTLLPERREVVTVPQTAITYNPYGDMVFVIEEHDGSLIVQRRQVSTGEVRNGAVEIRTGLKPGERVVTAGQMKLRNGQAVRIDDTPVLDGRVETP